MITAFTFVNGSVLFRNRFVRTNEFLQERKKKRILFKGTFGTLIPGGIGANILRFKMKNPANTNAVHYAGRLFALSEGGNPYLLEADGLRTVGKYRFKGVLEKDQGFTAHPKIDPRSGNLVGFSYSPSPDKTSLKIYEFDNNLKLIQSR
jgi:all-trans-8'-apo-beta-carotenal 15,15'-oxygenase